jgi:hypothetical protein
VSAATGTVLAALKRGGGSKTTSGKRWVRSETTAAATTQSTVAATEPKTAQQPAPVVHSFAEIDQLLQVAGSQAG